MKNIKKNVLTSTIMNKLIDFSIQDIKETFAALNTAPEGLDSAEAELRLEMHGTNEIADEKAAPWFVQLIKAFINPFIGVLIFLAGVSLVMDVILAAPGEKDWTAVIVITVMVTISGILRFFQEYRSNIEAEKLKALVHTTASVIRSDTGKQEIQMTEIVPGDLVHLAAGDMIPADVRIISSKDLFVSQSALTGESEPVEKYDKLKHNLNEQKNISLSDLDNICFMGTTVVSGSAIAVVLSTGNNTYFGSMAKSLVGQRALTSFDRGVNSVSWLLIRFMFVMVPIVFFVNGFTKGDWLQAFLFAISVAVGLTPEMLPMIVTTNLAKGAVAMAKRKTVVKRLNAIQNFGAMDILCTDKTGTLTLDKIVLERHLDIHGNEDDRVLRHACLNSFYQTGLKNLMDVAVLEFGAKKGFENLEKIYRKVDEIPFDFTRRRMSVVLQNGGDKRQLVTKGAVEEMLSICTFAEYRGEVVPLTDDIRKEVKEMVKQLNKEGMRVLAIAQKNNVPIEGLLSQTLIVHMIRTEKVPFIQSRAAKPVLLLTGTIMAIGIAIPFTAFGASIGLQPLPLAYFPWLIGILLSYCLLTQTVKNWYIKRYKTWL
ncbi:MAG: magnesium-translocating P-type ATPase [Clostridia bacterium]|nr:magnesium-translocating P-type ATPase [Clostridia bacterium]